MNPAMDKIEAMLHAAVPFQNRFDQFMTMAEIIDEFEEFFRQVPHLKGVWDKLCEANRDFVRITNSPVDL